MKKLMLSIGLTVALSLLLAACSSVMFTNRQRALLVSEERLAEVGTQQYQQIIAESKVSTDEEKLAMLYSVGEIMVAATEKALNDANLADRLAFFDWEFSLIDAPDVINAFILPGGKVVIYSGLFQVVDNEAELAVVIGHELGHAVAQHGNERMSQQLLVEMGGDLLKEALKIESEKATAIFDAVYGIGATVGVILPYSRTHEYEADKIGLILMAMSGYDPGVALDFWNEFRTMKGGSKTPEFLSTHPADDKRIAEIEKFLPEAAKFMQ